jgi:hypothetical protein
MKLEFSRQIFENTQIPNFMITRPVGAEISMPTDGQTDGRTDNSKLTVNFRNFANRPKIYSLLVSLWPAEFFRAEG